MFSMVISVVISVISVDFGDFGESCYPILPAAISDIFKESDLTWLWKPEDRW